MSAADWQTNHLLTMGKMAPKKEDDEEDVFVGAVHCGAERTSATICANANAANTLPFTYLHFIHYVSAG